MASTALISAEFSTRFDDKSVENLVFVFFKRKINQNKEKKQNKIKQRKRREEIILFADCSSFEKSGRIADRGRFG